MTQKAIIKEFFSLPQREIILFMMTSSGILMPMFEFPENNKSKIAYFAKLELKEVTQSNYESLLLCIELAPNLLVNLEKITEQVSKKV